MQFIRRRLHGSCTYKHYPSMAAALASLPPSVLHCWLITCREHTCKPCAAVVLMPPCSHTQDQLCG